MTSVRQRSSDLVDDCNHTIEIREEGVTEYRNPHADSLVVCGFRPLVLYGRCRVIRQMTLRRLAGLSSRSQSSDVILSWKSSKTRKWRNPNKEKGTHVASCQQRPGKPTLDRIDKSPIQVKRVDMCTSHSLKACTCTEGHEPIRSKSARCTDVWTWASNPGQSTIAVNPDSLLAPSGSTIWMVMPRVDLA